MIFKELLEDVKKHQPNKGIVCWFNKNGDLEYIFVSRDIFTKEQGDILLLPKPLKEYAQQINMQIILGDYQFKNNVDNMFGGFNE